MGILEWSILGVLWLTCALLNSYLVGLFVKNKEEVGYAIAASILMTPIILVVLLCIWFYQIGVNHRPKFGFESI